jgi:hypothetical protein
MSETPAECKRFCERSDKGTPRRSHRVVEERTRYKGHPARGGKLVLNGEVSPTGAAGRIQTSL